MSRMRLLVCLLVALVIDRIAAEVIDAAPTNESARPDCSKYLSFLEAWQSGNTSSEWDPRRLNTNHLKGCTEPDAPRRQLATPQRLRVSFNGPEYALQEVMQKSLYFYESQRAGSIPRRCTGTVSNNPYSNILTCTRPAWRGNSSLNDQLNGRSLAGGYYDAGDHIKFGMPLATTTIQLLLGVIFHTEGYQQQLDRARQTVRWALDYMVKAHSVSSDPSVLVAQVGNGDMDHSYWGRPEQMKMGRPAYTISKNVPGTDVWAATAAALAGGARLFKLRNPTLAATYLTHAQQLFEVAKTSRRAKYSESMPFANPFYTSSGFLDDLATAAAFLHLATGSSDYLNQAKFFFEQWIASGVGWHGWDWDNQQWSAAILIHRADPGYQPARNKLNSFISAWRSQQTTPQGMAWLMQWGSARLTAAAAFMFTLYADAPANVKNNQQRAALYCWAQAQIRLLLGDAGRSYVVGFGINPPKRPHHRGASCPNMPASCGQEQFNSAGPNPQILYGALVGGPRLDGSYQDIRSDYIQNEVAIDYNAGFTGAIAGLIKRRPSWPNTCSCMLTKPSNIGSCTVAWRGASSLPKPGTLLPQPSPQPGASPVYIPPNAGPPTCNPTSGQPIAAWQQCGGAGGECPGCGGGQCVGSDCRRWDAPWRGRFCATSPYGKPTKCCRINQWYFQCMETVNGGCPTPQYSDPCSNGGSKPLSQQSMALAAAVRSGNISVSSAQADDFVTFKEAMQLAERAKQKAEAKYRAEAGGRT